MTFAHHLARFTVVAAIAAAGITAAGSAPAGNLQTSRGHDGSPTVRIIELPRVTVIARRAAPVAEHTALAAVATQTIIELPRVLVVAKRLAPTTTLVAERALKAPGA